MTDAKDMGMLVNSVCSHHQCPADGSTPISTWVGSGPQENDLFSDKYLGAEELKTS